MNAKDIERVLVEFAENYNHGSVYDHDPAKVAKLIHKAIFTEGYNRACKEISGLLEITTGKFKGEL